VGGVGAILGKNFNVWQHALKKMQEGGGVGATSGENFIA